MVRVARDAREEFFPFSSRGLVSLWPLKHFAPRESAVVGSRNERGTVMFRGLSPVSSEDNASFSQALIIPANLSDGQGEIVHIMQPVPLCSCSL